MLVILSLSYSVSGQYASDNGLFFVDQVRGCTGLTVTITNNNPVCDCVICACNFDYNGDGMYTVQPNKYIYTYNNPGVYRLEILFSGTSDFITITIEDKPAPDFEVQRCGSNGVYVVVNDTNYDSYEIDFGDGTAPAIVPGSSAEASHTYGSSGGFPVSVRGLDINSANNCGVNTKSFTARPLLNAPVIQDVVPVDANSVDLSFMPGDENTLYNLLASTNGGSFQTLQQLYSSDAVTPMNEVIPNLDLNANFYCFRIEAVDPCTGARVPSPADGCTIKLGGENISGINRLSWAGTDPDTGYELYRDGILLTTLPPGERQFDDTDLICGQTYCYTLTGLSAVAMRSLEVCVNASSTLPPPAVEELSISPNGNDLALSWLYQATLEFDIYRTVNEGNRELIGSVSTTEFMDTDVVNSDIYSYCYEVVPRDACGNANPANSIGCAYTPAVIIDNQDQITVSWPPYSGFASGIDHYDVEKSYDGSTYTVVTQTMDTLYMETDGEDDNQVIYFRIKAFSSNPGVGEAVSYVVIVYKSNRVTFPNAFTPDGDGLNDLFEVNARFVSDYEMDIFNRWGELIFHSDNIDVGWDGTYRGEPVQQGTYIVQIRLTDESGRESKHDGSIVLLGN